VPIGNGPDSVAFDPLLRRIYTTGKSGVLVVIQQDEPNEYKYSIPSICTMARTRWH